MKILQDIKQSFGSFLDKLELDIVASEELLRDIKTSIASKRIEEIDLHSKLDSAHSELKDVTRSIENKLSEYNSSVAKLTSLQESKSQDIVKLESKIGSLNETIKVKTKELDGFKDNEKAVSTLKKNKIDLENDIRELSVKVVSQTDELRDLDTRQNKIIREYELTINDLDRAISSKRNELDALRENVLPTIEKLNEREALLDQREKDINIVIQRYKDKYKEVGAGFKI